MATSSASPATRLAEVACNQRTLPDRRAPSAGLLVSCKRSSAETVTARSRIELLGQRHHRWPLGKFSGADQLGIGKGLRVRIGAFHNALNYRRHPGVGVEQLRIRLEELLDEEPRGIRMWRVLQHREIHL